MAHIRDPKDAWEKTYGFTQPDGSREPSHLEKKRGEIETYFGNSDHPRHNDFRDFFSALGVMEGSGKYEAQNGEQRGIYQIDETQLDYIEFFPTYGKSLNVKNMDDFQKNPIAQEIAGLLSFVGTPGGKDSRFRATADALKDYDLDSFAKDGGTTCWVTFVDSNNKDWQKTVKITINYASVSAAAHFLGQGKMARILESIIAGYESDVPARININDAHDGNNVLFTAYMDLMKGYDISGLVNAKPSQSFDTYLASLLEGRKEEITDSLKGTDPYNQVLDNANLDAVKKVFKSPASSDSGLDNTYRPPASGGSSWPSTAQQPPTGNNPYTPPAGKNPPGPYETPPTSSPLRAFSYLDLVRRPNALGPIPPMWDPGALPTGKNWLAGDSSLNLPSAAANLPFQYSPSGVTGPVPSGQAAPASMDYPTRPLPSDSPFFPRRNAFLESAQPMTPWAQPQSSGKGSPALLPFNLLGPWPGSYLEGSPDVLQNGSRNAFDPWPGSYPPGRKNPVYPDFERLLGRPF